MSYRTFKRVLGETNLERKCRWWFGISVAVMLTLSFTWYGRQTNKLVEDRIQTLSQELVRAGWQKLHIEKLAEVEEKLASAVTQDRADTSDNIDFYRNIAQSSIELSRAFLWDAILAPPLPDRAQLPPNFEPRADQERQLLAAWAVKPAPAESVDGDVPAETATVLNFDRRTEIDGQQVYQYYQPMYASPKCVSCHRAWGQPNLREDDLMAVIRVTLDDAPTVSARAKNRALAVTAAIVVGFLSMIS